MRMTPRWVPGVQGPVAVTRATHTGSVPTCVTSTLTPESSVVARRTRQGPLPVVAVNLWFHVGSKDEPPRGNHFAIRVDDVAAAVEDLQAQGVEVHPVPHMEGAGRQAFLHDPFGNFIELNQPDS